MLVYGFLSAAFADEPLIGGLEPQMARLAWDRVHEAYAHCGTELPPDVRESLALANPNFVPFGTMFPPGSTSVYWNDWGGCRDWFSRGNLNGDGTTDFFVNGLTRSDPLVSALDAPVPLDDAALGRALKRLRQLTYDEAAVSVVGLSNGTNGYTWLPIGGHGGIGPIRPGDGAGCGPITSQDADLDFIRAHKLDMVHAGCCEKDGWYLVWDERTGQLVGVGGC